MTNYQLNTTPLEDLIIVLKNKARCLYSRHTAERVWEFIQERITDYDFAPLRLAIWHMQNEGSTADIETFDFEVDALLAHWRKYMKDAERELTKRYVSNKSKLFIRHKIQ